LSKKKSKKTESESIEPVIIRSVPGFSSQFKEDLAWWFRKDEKKASKILDLVTAVMQDPFISFPLNFGINDPPLPPLIRGVGGIEFVAGIFLIDIMGIGKPEPLKYLASDIWSRRIDLEHRLVYRVGDTNVDFLSCRYHYETL
jgi:toxin YoeB